MAGSLGRVSQRFQRHVDGGLRGWANVLGAWLLQFSMVGSITAFGSFQTFYQQDWLRHYSGSSISWIGTLQLFLEFCLGVFGGLLLDAGKWRYTVAGGSALFVFAIFMLSLCKPGQYAPIILAQGVGMGSGLGFAYLPVSALVSKHFTKRRALAMGIITTGTTVGGFTIAIICSKLFYTSLSFPWTVRVVAFIALGCNLAGNLLLSNPRAPASTPDVKSQESAGSESPDPVKDTELETWEGSRGKASDSGKDEDIELETWEESRGEIKDDETEEDPPRKVSELLRDPAYLAIIFGVFFGALGLYFPMFAIESFALQHGISRRLSSWLLSILNLSSVFGRIIPNLLADRLGVLEVYIPCTAAAAILVYALNSAASPGGVIAFSVLYGFFSGSIVSLFFPTVCELDPHVTTAGIRLGMACMPVGIASLLGAPISEALVGGRHWGHGLAFAGTVEIVMACLLAFALVMEKKRKKRKAV